MSARVWLYNELTSNPLVTALVGDRVFAKKSMSSSVEDHPYIVYKFGYQANEEFSEEQLLTRQFIQIFVHDFADNDSGDYLRIDDVLDALKQVLNNRDVPEADIIRIEYIETSQDLDDLTLSTVMKYIRFRMILKENTP